MADLTNACPWCGSRTEIYPRDDAETTWQVQCACGAAGPVRGTYALARCAWNQIAGLERERDEALERAETAERVAGACDYNITGVRAELLELKKTVSALQNRLAATDRDNAYQRSRVVELKRERDEAKKALEFTYCAYCGSSFPADHSSSAAVTLHVMHCRDHPMRVVERERDEALLALANVFLAHGSELVRRTINLDTCDDEACDCPACVEARRVLDKATERRRNAQAVQEER